MSNPDFTPSCACCGKPEAEVEDWYLIGGGGPVETWEFFCSKACFVAHEDRTCGCFEDDDDLENEWEDA